MNKKPVSKQKKWFDKLNSPFDRGIHVYKMKKIKGRTVEIFIKKVYTIKEVPEEISAEFWRVYGGSGFRCVRTAAEKLFNEAHQIE